MTALYCTNQKFIKTRLHQIYNQSQIIASIASHFLSSIVNTKLHTKNNHPPQSHHQQPDKRNYVKNLFETHPFIFLRSSNYGIWFNLSFNSYQSTSLKETVPDIFNNLISTVCLFSSHLFMGCLLQRSNLISKTFCVRFLRHIEITCLSKYSTSSK